MYYFTLKHSYEDITPYYFCSKMNQSHFEDFIAFLQFQYEIITEVTESLNTEDIYLILNSFSFTQPLNCKIQDVNEFIHLDPYSIREKYCGSSLEKFMTKMKQIHNVDVINSFLKETEAFDVFSKNP